MEERLKPLIDSTYPATMAGLCLTSLGFTQVNLGNFWVQSTLSLASFFFIASSVCIFVHSVIVEWGAKTNDLMQNDVTFFWKIGKWSFIYGIFLLLMAILLINFSFYLCLYSSFY